LILSISIAEIIPARATFEDIKDPQSYERYLEERGEKEPEALKIKKQFQELSNKQKLKFIYYIKNPQIFDEVLKAQSKLSENSTKELYNGDIVIRRLNITSILRVDNCSTSAHWYDKFSSILVNTACAASKIYHMKAEDTRETYTLGIKAFEFRAWVIYNSQDKKTVTSIQDGNGSATNYWITNKVIKDSVTKYVLGNKAHTCILWKITWNLSLPLIDPTAIASTWNHHVLGSANGGKTYRFYN
jgi:hypothetical protein